MAYYNSSDYGHDYGASYSSNLYYDTCYYTPVEDRVSYSDYNFNEHQIAYDYQAPTFSDCDPASTYSRIEYSFSILSEPKNIELNQILDYPQETGFVVSYSVSEFGEPEFDEYDPTPYGGGYDPAQTYGKPLPPSDEICYPRSTSAQNGVYLGSVADSLGEERANEGVTEQPQTESKPRELSNVIDDDSDEKNLGNYGEIGEENHVGEWYPSGKTEYEKQVDHQFPPGYGLEAMDMCESLFGYWPCLARYGRRGSDDAGDCGKYVNPWKGTADYLFGSSDPYQEIKDDDRSTDWYGNAMYS
ncbi:hypothetical protein K2173_004600 [Erythroxylum novogranatense]|uniref:Uncharacterized protein n=1 Tax=Erythroxylum novogranatense TaxID=1862640 RepID=A0AAV8T5F0_9ROSI|nr:hypothetical protein K2173_004600 [Erythroxylum novogranatense]